MCFNPCFNGYSTFTAFEREDAPAFKRVSILVLMDTLLLRLGYLRDRLYFNQVSILVLMDTLLLRHDHVLRDIKIERSFNPCFNGYSTFTNCWNCSIFFIPIVSILVLMDTLLLLAPTLVLDIGFLSFNPCFNGYSTFTNDKGIEYIVYKEVSILVLMDTLLLLIKCGGNSTKSSHVSILVLMDTLLLLYEGLCLTLNDMG